MKDGEDPEKKTGKKKRRRLVLLLLIPMFLILATLTSFLFYYYFRITEDLTHLKYNETQEIRSKLSELKNRDSWMTEELSYMKHNETELIKSELDALRHRDSWMSEELLYLKYSDTQVIKSELNQLKTKVADLKLKWDKLEPTKSPPCESDWLEFDGSCYYFYNTGVDWMTAVNICQSKGSNLAIINSEEEQVFLNDHINDRFYWIGLDDRVTEGVFVWIDGTSLSYTSWFDGEPNNNDGDEDCGMVWHSGKWNDAPCYEMLYAICEKNL